MTEKETATHTEWTAEEVASHDEWMADIQRQLQSLKTKVASSRDKLKHAWKVFLERQKAVDQLGPGNSQEENEKVDYILNAIWSLEFRAQEYKSDLALLIEFQKNMSLIEE